MIGVDVRSNMREVLAEFRARTAAIKDKAIVRALNRALDQTATEASREIRKVYNIKHAAVLKAMKKTKATSASLTSTMTLRGRRIGLIEFAARAVNPWNVKGRGHKPGGGVSVQIKRAGGRTLIKGAFIAAGTANNYKGGGSAGMLQVWRRIGYEAAISRGVRWNSLGGWREGGARGEEPIISLRSISLPKAFQDKAVLAAVKKVSNASFTKNYKQQIQYLNSKVRG
jgi:hypothetical protein